MNASDPPPSKSPHVSLVLAGGGIMGAAYEIGCLTALDQIFGESFSTNRFDSYYGVSAGSVIATLMASGIEPDVLFRTVAKEESTVFNWRRKDIYRFDMKSQFRSVWKLIRNLTRIFRHYRHNRWDLSGSDFYYILQEQFPSGLFSLDAMRNYLSNAFAAGGVINDFNQLDRPLYIPAYDLDRGTRVIFGSEGHKDVPICEAITASSAIPFFFRPVEINGRNYTDGSTGRVTHLDVAIENGATLIVVINPRVPMKNDPENICLPSMSYGQCTSIAELGIMVTWEQVQRIENKIKLDLALESCRRDHPEIDILLIEPSDQESMLFFQSPMSQVARHHVMNHGYHLTLSQLQGNFLKYSEMFQRHGIQVDRQRLHPAPPVEITT